jgi:hypothetical protein
MVGSEELLAEVAAILAVPDTPKTIRTKHVEAEAPTVCLDSHNAQPATTKALAASAGAGGT